MYVIEVDFATPQYDETIRLRHKLLREPLGMEFKVKDLEKEYEDIHLACYNHQAQLVGCLVFVPLKDGEIKMRQVAVVESVQKQGIGTAMVKASEAYAKKHNFKKIVLNARDVAIPFYKKLAYKKVGKEFIEVGIKHFKMEKEL